MKKRKKTSAKASNVTDTVPHTDIRPLSEDELAVICGGYSKGDGVIQIGNYCFTLLSDWGTSGLCNPWYACSKCTHAVRYDWLRQHTENKKSLMKVGGQEVDRTCEEMCKVKWG
ncbi:MAG: hypothetical protein LBJ95_03050 [Oscillospiraceae bacterium]|jgi:hypothetical protein|nr:hypothetical protein [Oscillospiraceae bacterium]